ncbi:MAG: HEPN domain-containing protein [Hymenobacter sp.]|nr:MAG: HEPN domain-containing protein [Hymenobacter sp.]
MQPLSANDKLHVQSWLAIADLDLRVAERMYAEDAPFYGYHVPFACQQAVEKYAKAVLVAYQLPVRRTHDLPALLQQLTSVVTFSTIELDQADLLADYAVDIRYPPHQQLALSEVLEALTITRHFSGILRPLAQAFLI